MAYCISDVQAVYKDSIRLIAGEGGLARPVREVGILDYELLPEVKQRFQRVNFYEGQLVLSTFLYAKDNPYLITEAIKFLVSKGSSGLVIKNVFHLQIPEGALRYANARNFPLFVTTGDAFLFDEVIAAVARAVDQADSATRLQRALDQLLLDRDDRALCIAHAHALNPSFGSEHRVLYLAFDPTLDDQGRTVEQWFSALEHKLRPTTFGYYTNLVLPYEDGMLLILSGERMVGAGRPAAEELVATLHTDILQDEPEISLGVSALHFDLSELPESITEALQATRFALQRGGGVVWHEDLGTYRLILPHLGSPALDAFAHAVLEPLRSYDAENNAHLMQTLEAFCDNGQSFTRTAAATGQHENTIRRHLDRISTVSGLSWRNPDDMEQLSIARKIELCRAILG